MRRLWLLVARGRLALLLAMWVPLVACQPVPLLPDQALDAPTYLDKARGYWLGALLGNYTGLPHEGKYLDEPSSADGVEWVLLEEYTTDDDTLVEWVNIHILEEHGLWPSYAQIRDEWMAHINHDIWWANRTARDLMAQGFLPPQTGQPEHNPHSGWNIDAQIESELFGVIAPGRPREARDRASYFARTTSHGDPVDAAAFYAILYVLAFFDSDPGSLVDAARGYFPPEATVVGIVDAVVRWHAAHPEDWRATRRLIRDTYDVDPGWNASRLNFASTLLALLYGDGDFERTVTIATLAGWDSDCNATTAAGLVGVMHGYSGLPGQLRDAVGHVDVNVDVTGELPERETLDATAARLQALTEQGILASGGHIEEHLSGRTYYIPRDL